MFLRFCTFDFGQLKYLIYLLGWVRSGFLELADHAGLGDGEGLLLHGLVYAGAVRLTDRAELVNAAHAAVSQHCRHSPNSTYVTHPMSAKDKQTVKQILLQRVPRVELTGPLFSKCNGKIYRYLPYNQCCGSGMIFFGSGSYFSVGFRSSMEFFLIFLTQFLPLYYRLKYRQVR